jgi:hypothetical protein
MKKVMLFIVSMLFAVSASAATMTITDGSQTAPGSLNFGSGTNALNINVGGYNNLDVINDNWTLTTDVESTWLFTITPNANQGTLPSPFSSVLDGTPYANVGGVITFSMLLGMGDHDFSVLGTALHTLTSYDVTINQVPVPAALFLFAPALLGFMGLRRKAKLAA